MLLVISIFVFELLDVTLSAQKGESKFQSQILKVSWLCRFEKVADLNDQHLIKGIISRHKLNLNTPAVKHILCGK